MPNKKDIELLFNQIAPTYDKLNHIMSFGTDRGWRRRAVRSIVDENRHLDILDVATGTGDFAIAIQKKAVAGSHIVGIDISEKMLEIGRQKAGTGIVLEEGDCEHINYPDGRFDRVSVAFGIRNFEKLEQGLSEMCRVLKPGGKLVVLELSYPDSKIIQWAYKLYSLKILPIIGKLISGKGSAYHYLPDSIMRFPKPDKMVPMLKDAGFETVRVRKMTFGVCLMYVAEKHLFREEILIR